MNAPSFAIDTADAEAVRAHLQRCADAFIPPLRERVDVDRYAKKLADRATTFEAWDEGALVGLVAAYTNDRASGVAFVTSVSVDRAHAGRGVARTLLQQCLAYATEGGFGAVSLEVSAENTAALRLYERSGFRTTERAGTKLTMRWQRESGNGP